MGGKSKSRSSSTTETSTQNIDKRIGAASGALVATEGATVQLQSADPQVIEAALSQAFDFGGDAAAKAVDIVDAAFATVSKSLTLTDKATSRALDAQSSVGEAGALKKILSTTTALAVVGAVAFAITKGR